MFSVLIVDDHRHLVEDLATTFPWRDYGVTSVYQAFSGEEALKLIERIGGGGYSGSVGGKEIDLVLTDIRMPGLSGLELIEALRRQRRDIDCILITGFADFQYARRAIELQAVSYLMKPVRHEELAEVLRRIMVQRKSKRLAAQEQEREAAFMRIQLEQLKADLLMARSMAESSIREERNRIAEDIHDLVGHTLTATLVQIESAKRMLEKKPEEGLQRLDYSQELVRKSLDDIRETVRRMKQVEAETDLGAALEHLIRHTETAAEITVERELCDPLPPLDALRKKLIYHALQEGLTNGIRHGGATHFRCEVTVDAGVCEFALWNNGEAYPTGTEPGFGLRAMMERAAEAGGELRIEATEEPAGTYLTIRFPI
ncbi:response regulator [Paenibacillus chartarius]|uniref:histidine kinase n=1 Tax=Paenibacillus chartarius TaxID=747481 RepID=A0ABV6DUT9_9BACL